MIKGWTMTGGLKSGGRRVGRKGEGRGVKEALRGGEVGEGYHLKRVHK